MCERLTLNNSWAIDLTFKTNQFGLPLYAIVAPNPMGIGILLWYMRGSFDKGKCTKKFRKKWFDKKCREARKCLMILDIVKDKENYQKHLHEYKWLIQRKRTIWEVTQQFIQTQEKAHACDKFWGNLKGKHVESYGDLTLHD